MQTCTVHKTQKWWAVKAKIVARYGSLTAAARVIGCSVEALRQSTRGKCPRVARKLAAILS